MGLERVITGGPSSLVEISTRLLQLGVVVMVDNAFVTPGKPLPETWRDVRVKTPAGTVSIVRRAEGLAVVVFGNADEALQAMQLRIAAALAG